MPEKIVNSVEFGAEALHFATYDKTNKTFSTPVRVPGMVSLKLKSKTNDIVLYADNGVFFSLTNNNGYDGDLEIYNFDDDFRVNYLGYKKDANGVLVEPSILIPKPLALLFKISGDTADRVSVLYNVIFGKADLEYKTIDEKVDVPVLKIPITVKPIEINGFDNKIIQSSVVDQDKKATWFNKVYLPSKTAGSI